MKALFVVAMLASSVCFAEGEGQDLNPAKGTPSQGTTIDMSCVAAGTCGHESQEGGIWYGPASKATGTPIDFSCVAKGTCGSTGGQEGF